MKSGNPPPTNYFKSKEVNYNSFIDNSTYDEYADYNYYDFNECVEYQQPYEYSVQELSENSTETPQVEADIVKTSEQDFPKDRESDTLK